MTHGDKVYKIIDGGRYEDGMSNYAFCLIHNRPEAAWLRRHMGITFTQVSPCVRLTEELEEPHGEVVLATLVASGRPFIHVYVVTPQVYLRRLRFATDFSDPTWLEKW